MGQLYDRTQSITRESLEGEGISMYAYLRDMDSSVVKAKGGEASVSGIGQ